jgi:hypothetical protein
MRTRHLSSHKTQTKASSRQSGQHSQQKASKAPPPLTQHPEPDPMPNWMMLKWNAYNEVRLALTALVSQMKKM